MSTSSSSVYIIGAARTPIGKMNGTLAGLSAVQLGTIAAKAAIDRSHIKPELIDQVFFGNALQAGNGQNPARQVAINAGLSQTVPATTVNDVCASGLHSINLAAQLIRAGEMSAVLAGGMESMSNAPYLLRNARRGYRLGDGQLVDALQNDGLIDAFHHYSMGQTAENVAEQYQLTRQKLDQFAQDSQQKAIAAQQAGRFADEIVPVTVPLKHGQSKTITLDEGPRPNSSLAKLSQLKPAFSPHGVVTAGNSSGINDGAAAVILASGELVNQLGLTPLARWDEGSLVGLDPAVMGLGPIPAIRQLMAKSQLSLDQVDLFEINEAFAAQSLAVIRELQLPASRVNPNGGAIALGHPLAASGARIVVTLAYEMSRRHSQYGIAALCVGGGMGAAALFHGSND
ncbi:acetyl-CoA C-acetyltransferase [uncultured Limosilactobacillus sp.]|uniref:thiolase family protein n=1 Tax=uncultured Limosilactobacillus sp. TaxID=2837629 RepID=UPI0025ED1DBC|nr:acetyl-CoA C-acetyltransferase [uncultured Limosilactobacillus sp.]